MTASTRRNRLTLSIIVVTWNSRDDLPACFDALQRSRVASEAEWIVVDNASTDGTADWVAGFDPSIRLIRSEVNLGFARANQAGLHIASGDTILFLNPDTIALDGFPDEMLDALSRDSGVGAAGPRAFWDTECRFLISCLKTPTPLELWMIHTGASRWIDAEGLFRPHWEMDWRYWAAEADPVETPAIGGAYLMAKRAALDSVGGGFDPRYFLGYEDVDLGLRLRRRGWKLLSVPTARIVHFLGNSRRRSMDSAICRSWNAGPGAYLKAHYNALQVRSVTAALMLESLLKRSLKRRFSDSVHTPPQSPRSITLSWPVIDGDVLVEIATTRCFFDKFAVRSSGGSTIEIPADLARRLSPGRHFFRVIRTLSDCRRIHFEGTFA